MEDEIIISKQVEQIVSEIIYSDFSEKDLQCLEVMVTKFLNLSTMTEYFLSSLFDKIVSSVGAINNQPPYTYYRKFVRAVLTIGGAKLIDAMETFVARGSDPECLLIVLEEELEFGHNTTNAENLFLVISEFRKYGLQTINRFLSIIGKDYDYLTSRLLENDSYEHLARIIQLLPSPSEKMVPIVFVTLNYPHKDIDRFIDLAIEIIGTSSEFTVSILEHKSLTLESVSKSIFQRKAITLSVIANISAYLSIHYPHELDGFEKQYLLVASSKSLIDYALYVPTSNKRRVLKQLINIRKHPYDEQNLVTFIQYFPEYQALLPML